MLSLKAPGSLHPLSTEGWEDLRKRGEGPDGGADVIRGYRHCKDGELLYRCYKGVQTL